MTGSILTVSGSAEAHALSEAIASLRQTPNGPEELATQLDLLVARCRAFPEKTRRLWDWFEARRPCAGISQWREALERHLTLLDERVWLVHQVQSLAAEQGASPLNAPLAAALSDLATQRNRTAALLERINAPMPPSSEPEWTTADCRAAFERGDYETIESIVARVEAGGPVGQGDAE